MPITQKKTSRAPTKVNAPGTCLHQRDSVTRVIRISVARNTAMRVGLSVMKIAETNVQVANKVMDPDKGRKTAALVGNVAGLVRIRFVRNIVDTRDRRTLEQPLTNISFEVDTPRLLHFAATTLATDAAKPA